MTQQKDVCLWSRKLALIRYWLRRSPNLGHPSPRTMRCVHCLLQGLAGHREGTLPPLFSWDGSRFSRPFFWLSVLDAEAFCIIGPVSTWKPSKTPALTRLIFNSSWDRCMMPSWCMNLVESFYLRIWRKPKNLIRCLCCLINKEPQNSGELTFNSWTRGCYLIYFQHSAGLLTQGLWV